MRQKCIYIYMIQHFVFGLKYKRSIFWCLLPQLWVHNKPLVGRSIISSVDVSSPRRTVHEWETLNKALRNKNCGHPAVISNHVFALFGHHFISRFSKMHLLGLSIVQAWCLESFPTGPQDFLFARRTGIH